MLRPNPPVGLVTAEIRQALKYGYKILNVYKTIYFKRLCFPFKNYVTDLYNKRMEYKKEGNEMEGIIKLCLNGLYGKFGEKTKKDEIFYKDNFVYNDKYIKIENVNDDFIRAISDGEPKKHNILIWAVYVTAYARIKINKLCRKYNALYCDTDSIITDDIIKTSNDLGDLKLEHKINELIIIKPKFYALTDYDNKYKTKIKGINKKFNFTQFKRLFYYSPKKNKTYITNKIFMTKFTKFRESIRLNKNEVNEIKHIFKELSLNDDKRKWLNNYNGKPEKSKPHHIVRNLINDDLIKNIQKLEIEV